MRSPLYGKIQSNNLSMQVRQIWYSKNNELPELPVIDLEQQWNTGLNSVDNKMVLEFLCKEADFKGRRRQVFYMRFILEMTLEEIGEKLLVTREAVRQIESRMVRKLTAIALANKIISKRGVGYEFH